MKKVSAAIAPGIQVKLVQTSGRDPELDRNEEASTKLGAALALRGNLFSYNPETQRYAQWQGASWSVQIWPPSADVAATIGQALGAFWAAVGTGRLADLTKTLKTFAGE